jgi:uracil-DNA glycosylase
MAVLTTPRPRGGLEPLLHEVRACTLCVAHLPQPPRPVLQVDSTARILIAGQAPGRKVERSGIPFDDASGDRLRLWMGIDKEVFHDPRVVAIMPMGFCFPGTGRAGDLPPRPECAPAWRTRLLERMRHIRLTLVIGQYAQAWHLKQGAGITLTETVRAWRDYWPEVLPLPHPSPRNNIWLRRNPWFEEEVVPALRARVQVLRQEARP